MKLVKGYTGVYKNELENGDIAYHITWKWDGKKEWLKIGLHSEGVRLAYCKKRRSAIMVALRNGETPPITLKNKSKFTLDQVADDFFIKKAYTSHTKRTIEGRYRNHISPALGKKQIESISLDDIEALHKAKDNDKNCSNKSVQLIMEQLSAILNYAISVKKYHKENPCKSIKLKKVDNARQRYLNKQEIELLLERVSDNKNAYLFTLLSLSTGARLADVYNMKKKQFNLENRTVTIKNTKGKTTYQAFLTKRVLKVLDLTELEPNDILFDVSQRVIERYMKKVFDELFNVGLDAKDAKNRVVIHTLRHTFASLLAISGTPIFTIQKLLDHKDIKDTLRYAKLSPDNGREFVENLF